MGSARCQERPLAWLTVRGHPAARWFRRTEPNPPSTRSPRSPARRRVPVIEVDAHGGRSASRRQKEGTRTRRCAAIGPSSAGRTSRPLRSRSRPSLPGARGVGCSPGTEPAEARLHTFAERRPFSPSSPRRLAHPTSRRRPSTPVRRPTHAVPTTRPRRAPRSAPPAPRCPCEAPPRALAAPSSGRVPATERRDSSGGSACARAPRARRAP